MKKYLAGFMVLVFLMVSVIAYAAPGYWWNQELKATSGKDGRSWLHIFTGADIIFEGATSDDYETTLTVEDPTADRTITLPDYIGGLPLVVGQSNTTTTITGATSGDVTGSSITLPAGWVSTGKTLRWTVVGTKSGANAQMKVHLYLLNADVMSLTASDNTAADWKAEFILSAKSGTASQNISGCFYATNLAPQCDYATATKDASGSTVAKVRIQSQNASDNVTSEYTLIEHWVK